MKCEQILYERAQTQAGLIAKFQLYDLDLTPSHWWRARRSAHWEDWTPRVLRLAGSPESDAQRALAAVLDASPGGMLHGQSALAWLGMSGYNLAALHVARPRALSGGRSELAKVHRLRHVRSDDLVVVRGVPTETAVRAIWNMVAPYASRTCPERQDVGTKIAGRLLDEANRLGLVTWAGLREAVEREEQMADAEAAAGGIAKRGRAGTVIMRAAAEQRTPGESATESRNEARFEEILADAGLPSMRRQVVVGGQEPIGRADYRDHDLPLLAEVNSVTYHTSPSDRAADQIRYRRFNDAGHSVAVIWEIDLWKHPQAVVRTMVDARRHARVGARIVVHSPSCPWPSR